jgi:hypothetical protein
MTTWKLAASGSFPTPTPAYTACGTNLCGPLLHEISHDVFLILSILGVQLAFRVHDAAWPEKYPRQCANRLLHGTDYGLSSRIHWRVWDSCLREIPGEAPSVARPLVQETYYADFLSSKRKSPTTARSSLATCNSALIIPKISKVHLLACR